MGCDIHTFVEWQTAEGPWQQVDAGKELFGWRSYGLFGWLADIRNYSEVPSVAAGRGLPTDVSGELWQEYDDWGLNAHSVSWVSLDELLAFDYDAAFEDRRVTIGNDGGRTAEPGGGLMLTYREFLGTSFFDDLDTLARIGKDGPTRLVFWFDS